jgi:hypothetical protein
MRAHQRTAFSLFQLLVVLALLAVFLGLFFPAIVKIRAAAKRAESVNNLKQLALACHNRHDAFGSFPPGCDANHFSAGAYLLPFVEQDNLFNQIDFKKSIDDKANAAVRKTIVRVFVSPNDLQKNVFEGYAPTNYLFSAGSKAGLADNDGVFYQDSKTKLPEIADGTSNTIMIGETLKGDGGTKAVDVRRQHVKLDEKALKDLKDDSGVQDWKDNKNIAGNRCASWMDGRFLQGTFTATRMPNDVKPDVDCGGAGGLSGLRSMQEHINTAFCDGSVRSMQINKIKMDTWKALVTRNGGEVIDFNGF